MYSLCNADSHRARAVTDWRVFDSGVIYKKFLNLVQTGILESGNPEIRKSRILGSGNPGSQRSLIKISYKIIIFVTFILNRNGGMYIEVVHNPAQEPRGGPRSCRPPDL